MPQLNDQDKTAAALYSTSTSTSTSSSRDGNSAMEAERQDDDSEWQARHDVFRTATSIGDHATLRELAVDDAALHDDTSDSSTFGFTQTHTSLFSVRTDADALAVLRVREHSAASLAARLGMRGRANRTPLFTAVMHSERTSVARVLLEDGADANARDELDGTPLHFAANSDMVALLLAHGASVDAQDANGTTPLFRAVRTGRIDVVRALLDAGADVHHCDARGHTAMFESDLITDSVAALEVLLAHGASVTVASRTGETPLHRAATYGKLATVRFLVNHGAPIDAVAASSETPLYQAARFGRSDAIEFLLQRGASVHGVCASEKVPVVAAARHGHLDTVADLLANGAALGPVPLQQRQSLTRANKVAPKTRMSAFAVLDVLIEHCDAIVPQQLRAAARMIREWTCIVETALFVHVRELQTLWRPVLRKLSGIAADLRGSESFTDTAITGLTHELSVQLARIVLQLWQWVLTHSNSTARKSKVFSTGTRDRRDTERGIARLLEAVDELRAPLRALDELTACWTRRLASCSDGSTLLSAIDSGPNALRVFVRDKLQGGAVHTEQRAMCRLDALDRLYDAALALLALHNQGADLGDFTPRANQCDGNDATQTIASECTTVEQSREGERVRWLPPEALQRHTDPAAAATCAADVYSFGMFVLEATSERMPWGTVSSDVVRVLTLAGRLPTRPSRVSDAQWSLITRMCVREPSKRLTMPDVVDSLLQIVYDERQQMQESS